MAKAKAGLILIPFLALLAQHGFREFPVDGLIIFPVFDPERRACMGNVTQRPQTFVRKTEIEAILFFLRQPNSAQRILRMIGGHAHAAMPIHRLMVRVTGSLSDPNSVAGPKDRLDGGNQAAGRHGAFDPVSTAAMFVRLTIRYGA